MIKYKQDVDFLLALEQELAKIRPSKRDGSLAQLVEQRTFNPLVPRSNRGRPPYFEKSFLMRSFFSLSHIMYHSL